MAIPVATGPGAGSQRPPASVIRSPSSSQQSAGPPQSNPAAVGTIGNDSTKSIAEAGQTFSQGFSARPVLEAGKDIATGDDKMNVSGNPAGKTGGFPDSGGGPGTGRQPAAAGSTISGSKAAARTPMNAKDGFGGSNPRKAK